jgi:hypothetical protein
MLIMPSTKDILATRLDSCLRAFPQLDAISIQLSVREKIEYSKSSFEIPYRYEAIPHLYYAAYFFDSKFAVENFEAEIFHSGVKVGLCPLTVNDSDRSITSGGEPILFPFTIFPIESEIHHCLQLAFVKCILEVTRELEFSPPAFQEYEMTLSRSLDNSIRILGAAVNSREVYKKNCAPDLDELWRDIRKSSKSLINRGLKELKVDCVTGFDNLGIFEEFRSLHKFVSGRVTRNDKTWEVQKCEFKQGMAFISAVTQGDKLVGGSYIPHNGNSALYAVNASDRAKTEYNLGHLGMWVTIKHLNSIGIRDFRLGHLEVGANSHATEKEISIAQFKRGYASHLSLENIYIF